MFSSSAALAYSVTNDPISFLDDAIDKLVDATWPKAEDLRGPFWEAAGQKRADKSASSEAVKKLLTAAAAGGMTQKDFEMSVTSLRSDSRRYADAEMGRAEDFRGALWHYYMTYSAQMSLLAIEKFAVYFRNKGWLSEVECLNTLNYATEKIDALAAVKKMFPPGVPPDWEIEPTTRSHRTKRISVLAQFCHTKCVKR
jgi:hypothetical protein